MALIDTHSHIYLSEFDNDRTSMLDRAEKESITKILMPAIDTGTHKYMLQSEHKFPNLCLSMMGLHPCSVKEDYQNELQVVHDFLIKRKFIAIGETGLDFYWDLTFKVQQYEAFQKQIEWALHYDIPVVIHSRNSTEECIAMIQKNQNGKLKGVFHCFSGTLEQAHHIIKLGFYLGIGGVLTFKKSGLDSIIEKIGLDHVILETDAPYLAPVPFRGKRNESGYLKYIAQKIAEIKQKKLEEISQITTKNAQNLFGL
ncbi:MAG: TatD family hydrolase [Bacteroidetes bacterium]|nr:TatD family hydrolase [Bacteroidota bacterium]MBS1931049.1 TatD family hydrolase [Bacteroidota bacterium]